MTDTDATRGTNLLQRDPERTAEEVFLCVFRSLKFPFMAADLTLLCDALEEHRAEDGSWCELGLSGDGQRKAALRGAWRGLLQKADVPDWALLALASSPTLQERFPEQEALRRLGNVDHATFAISSNEHKLRWEETTVWPAAYSTLLQQLEILIFTFEHLIRTRLREMQARSHEVGLADAALIADQYSKSMPTALHYACASLGAWRGGAANVQFFSHYAVEPQTRDHAYAVRCSIDMGYTPAEAVEMQAGGLVAVPALLHHPLAVTQGNREMFGGICINEINLANPPRRLVSTASPKHLGLLFDKHYRAPFLGRPLSNEAVHGGRNVLRDHYDSFYRKYGRKEIIRCKHYCAPVYDVESVDEMRTVVADIPVHDATNGLFYRGQNRYYGLDRPARIRRFLFASSCGNEPSLLTSASRRGFDYDSFHFALRHYLEHYRLRQTWDAEPARHERWRMALTHPTLPIDHAVMALAQHYGIPSHGLDVTTSLDVATWFATQRYTATEDVVRYEQPTVDDWGPSPQGWPTIFVCQIVTHSLAGSLRDCVELEEFGLHAPRPSRQSARFFLGGHTDHQNRLAEAVVCVLRLKPGRYQTECNFESLFPTPQEDPAYAAMLSFSETDWFKAVGAGLVNRFHERETGER